MRNRLTTLLSAAMMLTFPMAVVAPAFAGPVAQEEAAAATEDIIYMNDQRELHGNIISETPSEIVFEYINRKLNLRSTITLRKAEIVKIERDVPIPAEFIEEKTAEAATNTGTSSSTTGAVKSDEKKESTYGIYRADEVNEFTKRIYVVPMEGQMGTDVNPDVYKGKIVANIRELDPDYIVIKIKCMDTEDRIYTRWNEEEEANPDHSGWLDTYRELISIFRDELRDIPQVVWVEDSMGISSIVAMAWPDVYMQPSARFGGLGGAAVNFLRVKDDFNTFGKYREAYMAMMKGFAEYGGYDHKLVEAMVIREKLLSASWAGRNVEWRDDDTGEYVVDFSDEHTVSFRAYDAEDFGISDGTAGTMDDLALLLGIREYVVLDGIAEKEFTDHKEAWRRALGQCETLWNDYERFLSWAQGEDTVRYLGKAIDCLEKILAAIERYEAVEHRLMEHGLTKIYLTVAIDRLRERLRAARSNNRGGGLGGGGTGTGRGGGGGGPARR